MTTDRRDRPNPRGRRFKLSEVRQEVIKAVHAARFDMIVRMTGGKHVQVINTWDEDDKVTKFRARKVDSHGRSQSELTPWFDSYDAAVTAALEMQERGPFSAKDIPHNG